MNSEKVKEIKECLQSCNDDKMACYDCKYYEKCEKILTKNNILTLINELESENETLRNAKVVYETVDYCYEDLKKAEKRIAELEKEDGELKEHVTEVEKGIINIAKERNKKDELASKFIDSYNDSLKQFAEKVKEKALSHCKTINCYELKFIEETIDELLMEFIND